MPVETSTPVAGQTKTSVLMVPSVTRPADQNETAIEHAVQDGSRATQQVLVQRNILLLLTMTNRVD